MTRRRIEADLTVYVETQSAPAARARLLTAALHWALTLLLVSLPFEPISGLGLANLTFTPLELLELVTSVLWLIVLVMEQRAPRLPRRMAGWAGLLLAIFIASALLAGVWSGAALKFTARQFQAVLLGLCVAEQLTLYGWPIARRLGTALVAGASLSAACGLLEITEQPAILDMLAMFKSQPTTAGGLLRLSATFAYANIAAMYYEAVLPVALVGYGLARTRRHRWALGAAALLLYLAALLTYSRAALVTATAMVVIVALAWMLFRAGAESGRASRRVLALSGVLLAILGSLLLLSTSFRARIVEPDVDRWYRAEYSAAPLERLAPNALAYTRVMVVNRGLVTWLPDGVRPIRLAYHWLDAQTQLVARYNGRRTPLPGPVAPGQSVEFNAAVQAPELPGQYILVWDMVSEDSGWFSERGNTAPHFDVTVAGPPAPDSAPATAEPSGLPRRIEARPQPPARSQLWSAALRLWQARPLLGIGPDVFRHVYGPELHLDVWDDSIHTNNLYIEVLVGSGVAGLVAFLGLIVTSAWTTLRALFGLKRAADSERWLIWVLVGCGSALLAFLIHGTLDMFLEFSATCLLLWMALGALNGLAHSMLEPREKSL